jgi:abortive infection bacteriophage resistance protein
MSVTRPLKPYLTAIEQIALLKKRGLAIPDDAVGLQALARFGYYRLSGYYYPLRKTNPVGVPGRSSIRWHTETPNYLTPNSWKNGGIHAAAR